MISHPIQFGFSSLGEERMATRRLVWGHGWGHTNNSLLHLAQALGASYPSTLIDFPGAGNVPAPPNGTGTAEIADALAGQLRKQFDKPIIWIGHSFGCRVGIQLAARHPDILEGMVLISAAGLPRHRNFTQTVAFKSRIMAYKAARSIIPKGAMQDRVKKYFGSADYNSAAGPMRDLLIRVVNENLTECAAQVKCPTRLIYGSEDNDTPPEIGYRLQRLIPKSEMFVVDRYNHNSILTDGKHQVTNLIRGFVEGRA